jgi:medium-chain acyl-[acyl-carrier-protein] hydrolase
MPIRMTNGGWVSLNRPRPHAHLRLFCFPYAGGGATAFYRWTDQLPASVEVCPVQLPGRGPRSTEKSLTSLPQIIEGLLNELPAFLDKPFAFFGHSMGALICFELARELRRHFDLQPSQIFISGCRAPQLPDPDPPAANLPEPELLAELRRLDGTPREILEHRELLAYMLPILRADFNVCETYVYENGTLLSCPITGFGGLEDPKATGDAVEQWRHMTTGDFVLRMFPGGHFFIHTSEKALLHVLAADLLRINQQLAAATGTR